MSKNKNERKIHIVAESEILSVYEVVPERIAVKRLEEIRDSFVKQNGRYGNNDKLKVRTCVHNPELPYKF